MIHKLIQVVAILAICQPALASTENQVPEFIQEFAVELASKAFLYVENSEAIEDGIYSVSVIISDRKCNVVVESIEVELSSLDGELLEPLYRPLAQSIDCEPRP